ncbi:MAG: glycosyltransferase family 2 protein [Candidatus Pacearchaeota archaeon]
MKELRIVIPTKNEEEYLPKLLDSIKKQTYKDYVIVVADANSTDKTREIAKKYGCKIVKGGLPFFGRNNGVKGCKEKYFLFIDADVVLPHEHFLEKAMEEFKRKNLDLATFLQKPIVHKNPLKKIIYLIIHEIVNLFIISFQKTKFPLMQSLMLVKREVHLEVGGFPSYDFGEDAAFAKEAARKGFKFGVIKSSGKFLLSTRRYEKKGIFRMLCEYIYFNGARFLGKEHPVGKVKKSYWE